MSLLVPHNHNKAIQRNAQSPAVSLCFVSHPLSSISISLALLSPSVCVLCPLRWSLVSLMVPKMHCGFVGAVRRKGMCACVWAVRGDAVILTHERFSISSKRLGELLQAHKHTRTQFTHYVL